MKTIILIGIIFLSIFLILAVFIGFKREHYNAVSPNWKWNSLENSLDSYPEKCIAKPGKFFRQC
jgi:hypothetical protein